MVDIEDPAALHHYLLRTGHLGSHQSCVSARLAGGVSSRTVRVELPGGAAWVLKQALPKLRVTMDWFSDPMRVHREALGLRWLQQLLPAGAVPRLIFEDLDEHILAMEAVPQPHENWKTLLLSGQLQTRHVAQFAGILAAIHRGGWERRREVEPVFADRQFFESLRIEPYYQCSADLVPAAADFLHALIRETRENRWTLVHGDFSPKNILIHADRLILLDHEVIHFGDPAFDLGFALAHVLSKAHHLVPYRAGFAESATLFLAQYRERLGAPPWAAELEPRAVRQTLGCLLARVAGRSPLEYLSADERARQQEAVLACMQRPARGLSELIAEFVGRLSPAAS